MHTHVYTLPYTYEPICTQTQGPLEVLASSVRLKNSTLSRHSGGKCLFQGQHSVLSFALLFFTCYIALSLLVKKEKKGCTQPPKRGGRGERYSEKGTRQPFLCSPYLKRSTGFDGVEINVGDNVGPKVPIRDTCSFLWKGLLDAAGFAQRPVQVHGICSRTGVIANCRVCAGNFRR